MLTLKIILKPFFEHLKRSYEDGKSPKQRLIHEKYAKLSFPKSISSDEIIEFIDSEKRNITFSTVADLTEKVKKWISDEYLKKFIGMTKEEKAIVNLVISLRNFIAHQSEGSIIRLERDARIGLLKPCGLYNEKRGIPSYGEYLNFVHGEKTRFEIIITHMKKLGKKF